MIQPVRARRRKCDQTLQIGVQNSLDKPEICLLGLELSESRVLVLSHCGRRQDGMEKQLKCIVVFYHENESRFWFQSQVPFLPQSLEVLSVRREEFTNKQRRIHTKMPTSISLYGNAANIANKFVSLRYQQLLFMTIYPVLQQ